MGEKKKKDLALELIDDLLVEDVVERATNAETPAKSKKPDAEDDGTNPIAESSSSAPPPLAGEEDHTVRIPEGQTVAPSDTSTMPASPNTQTLQTAQTRRPDVDDHVRASVGRYGALRSSGPAS